MIYDFNIYDAKELERHLLNLYEEDEDVFFKKLDKYDLKYYPNGDNFGTGITSLILLQVNDDVIAQFRVSKDFNDLSLNILDEEKFFSNPISNYLLKDFDLRLLNGFSAYLEDRWNENDWSKNQINFIITYSSCRLW